MEYEAQVYCRIMLGNSCEGGGSEKLLIEIFRGTTSRNDVLSGGGKS